MEDILYGLNEAQLEAVTTTEGPVRVIAGAGSGKTRALTRRFAYLVNYCGIIPSHILCVTFTNKAAAEMRRRIHALTGDNDTGYVNTFHGFCVSVLQEDGYVAGYPRSFLVLDNSDIDQMLSRIYEERGLTLSDMTFADARDMIEMRKLIKEPEYYLDMIAMSADELREKYARSVDAGDIIFYGYLYQEKKCFALDYNDLLKFTLFIFRRNREVRHKWQTRLEYVMIDEFQDIDEIQYELMRVLVGFHRNIFIVGDPDQTIYIWRGASPKFIMNFDEDYPEVKTIMMMENYRSTPEIVSVCNSLISANKNRIVKQIVPTLPHGEKVVCDFSGSAVLEAEHIADKIAELHESGVPYEDFTVLYRSHYITRNIEDVFIRRKLPYRIYSGVQFFDRAEVKDTLAYLRMILLRDDLSFERIINKPKRGIGRTRMERLRQFASEHGVSLYDALVACSGEELFAGTGALKFIDLVERFSSAASGARVSELLSLVLNESGYEKMLRTEGSQERLDNLAELKQSIYEFENSCGEECDLRYYLNHAVMFTSQDTADEPDKVKLMTIHAAKGLEFRNVFICELNEGVLPAKRTETLQGMEEERRLAFVGMTRAKERLFLSTAQGRTFDGSVRYPSRFLLDIDEPLLSFTEKPSPELIDGARRSIKVSEKFMAETDGEPLGPGTRVEHVIFGTGIIMDANYEKRSYLVQFDTLQTPREISWRTKLKILPSLDVKGQDVDINK